MERHASASHESRSSVRHDKISGMSLAMKVTIATVAILALVMIVAGAMTYSSSRDALEAAIDGCGVGMAKALAAAGAESWQSDAGTLDQAADRVITSAERYPALFREKYGITVVPVTPRPLKGTREEVEAQRLSPELVAEQNEFKKSYDERSRYNKSRLQTLVRYGDEENAVDSTVIDAFILLANEDLALIRANANAKTFRSTTPERRFTATVGGRVVTTEAEIREGTIEGVGSVRSYMVPIRDVTGNVTHRAYVFLSKAKIDEQLFGLGLKTIVSTLIVLLVGGGGCYFLARRMTSPIMELVHDVDMVASGEKHHRSRVHTRDEIGLLARTMDAMVRRLDETVREAKDAALASDLHHEMHPEAIPLVEGFDLDVLRKFTTDIDGAYYDFLDLPGGYTALVVAQSSEKGVTAALHTLMVGTLLRVEAHKSSDPAEILARVNKAVHDDVREGTHVSAVMAVVKSGSLEVSCAGAGELPLYVLRAASGESQEIDGRGESLGIAPESAFQTTTVRLDKGDRIVLGNGGIERLANTSGTRLGRDRWLEIAMAANTAGGEDFRREVRKQLNDFLGDAKVKEDIIMMTAGVES